MASMLRRLLCSTGNRSALLRTMSAGTHSRCQTSTPAKRNLLRCSTSQIKFHTRHSSQLTSFKKDSPSDVPEDRSDVMFQMKEAKDSELFATKYIEKLEGDDVDLMKLIQLEYYVLESEGVAVPAEDAMNNERWLSLFLICPSRASRTKMYRYFLKVDNAKAKSKEQKAERRKADEERRERVSRLQDSGQLEYANRFLQRIYETTMNVHYYNNLFHAMQFGPKLIYDFSFEESMAFKEIKFALDQSVFAYAANKVHDEPFHLIWTNVRSNSKMIKMLPKAIRDYEDKPFTVTEQSYLDLYDKEQLVWLSPNATETMKTYDPNLVYIVGGIVDTRGQPPMTLARAKKEGIRALKLPVDHYLQWDKGSKNLTLDQVMKIMLEIKQTGDWKTALEHIPSRKIRARLH